MHNEKLRKRLEIMEKDIYCQIKELEILICRLIHSKNPNIIKPPTITQARIMKYIFENNSKDIYQKDLEKALNLRRATVSEVLATMERKGLIIRSENPNDARSKKIELAQLDNNKKRQIKEQMQQLEQALTQDISKEELLTFSLVLRKMQNNIKKQYNKQGGTND